MNTARALECLAFTALSAPELADSIQVSERTARRLLKRLALEGFATQEPGLRRRYHTTLRLAALGRQMLDHHPLTKAAAPLLAQLANDTSCEAHLWIPGYHQQIVSALHADRPHSTPPPQSSPPQPAYPPTW
jgi:DNA-binding IclR family transcriptional regulator